MNIQLNAEYIYTDEKNVKSYMVQVVVDGKPVTHEQHTTNNLSKLVTSYSKWASRKYQVENANVSISEMKWIPD